MAGRLLILAWHNVESTWCFPSGPGRGLAGLHRQLQLLSRLTTVLPLQEALDSLYAGERLPRRAVALTFDDGYADNLTLAAPALESRNLPATFFLVPGLLSGHVRAWWEVLGWAIASSTQQDLHFRGVHHRISTASLRSATYATLSQELKLIDQRSRVEAVAELVQSLTPDGPPPGRGLFLDWHGAGELLGRGFAVGSHSRSHAILSKEAPDEQQRDLREARAELEAQLPTRVPILAYPNGTDRDYDGHTLAAAAAAGHTYALTTREGLVNRDCPPLALPRVLLYPERGARDLVLGLRHAFTD